ncbi:ABC transporter transmembrane domain-containing protein, partial [Methylophaga sp. OBS4]|uniref:ABC transporter transmembrane domain-containing protein n=1 Tax=Methylophaga sp. OBS4 TaxID=2991935 RepID=UPI002250FF8E
MNTQTQWEAEDSYRTLDDPLLGCLNILAKMLNKPHSPESLTAGLPLVNNRLTPKLFSRAADRAGLSSKVVKRPLRKISNLVLPAVLLLNDTNACILLEVSDKTAKVIFPETGEGESEVTLKELEQLFSGYAIFIKPVHHFDTRTEFSSIPRTQHWFWGTILRFWPIYSEVFIASILVNSFALASPLFIMNVYDRVVPNHAIETLWVLAIGVATVFIFELLLRTLRAYFIDMAGKKADVILSATIFEKVMAVKMAARSNSVGSFANSMQEFESFRDFFTSATLTTLIDLPFAFLFIAVIWLVAGPVAYIPLAVIPVIILVSLIIQIPLGRTIQQLFRHSGQRSSTLIETLTGLETIKSIGAETPIQRKWEQTIGFMTKYSQRARLLSASAINFASFLQQMATISVVVFGVYLITENEITMGALIASTILTGRALAPMAQLAGILTRYHQSKA